MKRTSKTLRGAAVASAGALVLAACGGGGDDDDADGGGGSSVEADGVLTIGSLLPQTGSLSFLGPPEFAGVDLAVQEINEAGGVLGEEVVHERADSGDGEPNIAPGEVDNLLSKNADVIIGAAASGVSMTVIDQITGAGVVQFSPANTSPECDEYDDGGLYFRTAPSDVLQGNVLANLAASDGHSNLAILSRQDDYGDALSNVVTEVFEQSGGTVDAAVPYDPNATTFGTEIQQIADAGADAVALIAFDETKRIIPEMVSAGVGPADVQIYFVDGNIANYEGEFPEGTLEGVKATMPGPELSDDFRNRLLEIDPDLNDFTYSAESYDAVIVSALAAIAADSDAGTDVAEHIIEVTKDGTKCETFADCKELLENGEDIDYDGASGPIELGDTGSPTAATIGVYEYGANNNHSPLDYILGEI